MPVKMLYQRAVDLLFPRRCPICEEPVMPKGELICPECIREIHFIKEPFCKVCGREIGSREDEICSNCRRHRFSFEYGYALMSYSDVVAHSITRIKYTGAKEYLDFYGKTAARIYGDRIKSMRVDAIVPVPVHKSRLKKRGYNQAQVLAEIMGRELGIPVYEDALYRNKKTAALKELNAAERLKNLSSAFFAGEIPKDMRSVLIVDDIFTTGATMEATSRCLKSAGVEKVYCFSLAIKSDI
ncbi:ComF family protein [Oribacterium sp. P6A1]|uniref:ComF family protein n=1 Tax=Oribacterium sp. P6A1 TaxID=1410612 RepID=UPI000568761F|nr:ComF family protein [Oribacterium sp. P6A1]